MPQPNTVHPAHGHVDPPSCTPIARHCPKPKDLNRRLAPLMAEILYHVDQHTLLGDLPEPEEPSDDDDDDDFDDGDDGPGGSQREKSECRAEKHKKGGGGDDGGRLGSEGVAADGVDDEDNGGNAKTESHRNIKTNVRQRRCGPRGW